MYVRLHSSTHFVLTYFSLLKGQGPYAGRLKKIEGDIKEVQKRINEQLGTCATSVFQYIVLMNL